MIQIKLSFVEMMPEQIHGLLEKLRQLLPPEATISDHTQGLEGGFVDVGIKDHFFVIEFGDGNEVGISELKGDATDWLSGHEFVATVDETESLLKQILRLN